MVLWLQPRRAFMEVLSFACRLCRLCQQCVGCVWLKPALFGLNSDPTKVGPVATAAYQPFQAVRKVIRQPATF